MTWFFYSKIIFHCGARVGALFYYAQSGHLAAVSPVIAGKPGFYQVSQRHRMARILVVSKIYAQAWQRLFVGPARCPAGSVWLDRESVLSRIQHWHFVSGCARKFSFEMAKQPEDHLPTAADGWCAGGEWLTECG